jgi:4-carboxymuconolactone decarboxylase
MGTHTDNFHRGLDILAKIDPENYEDIMVGFEQSALPDLGTLAVEFNYGQIFSRPGLDLKSRLLAAVAGLTALGNTEQLRFYINGALNIGFPVALNTILTVANEVFYERNEKEKQNDY